MKTRNSSGAQTFTRGYSLVEVLVALLILALGLLGVAALQTIGIKFGHESYLRTQGVFQAYDMLDRMRANPLGLASYTATLGTIPPSSVDCMTGSCSAADLASYDMNQWANNNVTLLPGARSAISTTSNITKITIEWQEKDMAMTLIVDAQL